MSKIGLLWISKVQQAIYKDRGAKVPATIIYRKYAPMLRGVSNITEGKALLMDITEDASHFNESVVSNVNGIMEDHDSYTGEIIIDELQAVSDYRRLFAKIWSEDFHEIQEDVRGIEEIEGHQDIDLEGIKIMSQHKAPLVYIKPTIVPNEKLSEMAKMTRFYSQDNTPEQAIAIVKANLQGFESDLDDDYVINEDENDDSQWYLQLDNNGKPMQMANHIFPRDWLFIDKSILGELRNRWLYLYNQLTKPIRDQFYSDLYKDVKALAKEIGINNDRDAFRELYREQLNLTKHILAERIEELNKSQGMHGLYLGFLKSEIDVFEPHYIIAFFLECQDKFDLAEEELALSEDVWFYWNLYTNEILEEIDGDESDSIVGTRYEPSQKYLNWYVNEFEDELFGDMKNLNFNGDVIPMPQSFTYNHEFYLAVMRGEALGLCHEKAADSWMQIVASVHMPMQYKAYKATLESTGESKKAWYAFYNTFTIEGVSSWGVDTLNLHDGKKGTANWKFLAMLNKTHQVYIRQNVSPKFLEYLKGLLGKAGWNSESITALIA